MTPDTAQVASAGNLAKSVAGAADPGKSLLGRLGNTAAAIQLASRLAPAAWRLLKRYPLRSSLTLLGFAWAVYSLRSMNNSNHHE